MSSREGKRKTFIEICRRAFLLGIQVSTGGNLSLMLDQGRFLVKPTGKSLFDLHEEDLLICDPDGRVISGNGRPTKELNAHLKVYRVREDVGGIVHYHPPYATAFAVCGKEIPLKTLHAQRILGEIPVIPAEKEGSGALASAIEEAFSDPNLRAVILADHGIMAVGTDLLQAQNLAELVEETAKIALLSLSAARCGRT